MRRGLLPVALQRAVRRAEYGVKIRDAFFFLIALVTSTMVDMRLLTVLVKVTVHHPLWS